jgi:hypothetical protein
MKCQNCGKEYFDNGQIICEYCGNELISSQPNTQTPGKTKLKQFIDDSGIKDAYKKIKEGLRKLKE